MTFDKNNEIFQVQEKKMMETKKTMGRTKEKER